MPLRKFGWWIGAGVIIALDLFVKNIVGAWYVPASLLFATLFLCAGYFRVLKDLRRKHPRAFWGGAGVLVAVEAAALVIFWPSDTLPIPEGSNLQIVNIGWRQPAQMQSGALTIQPKFRNLGSTPAFIPRHIKIIAIQRPLGYSEFSQPEIDERMGRLVEIARHLTYDTNRSQIAPGQDFWLAVPGDPAVEPPQNIDLVEHGSAVYFMTAYIYKDQKTPVGYVALGTYCVKSAGNLNDVLACDGNTNRLRLVRQL